MTYIVMTSSAQMPTSVKVAYRHVALVELEELEDGFSGYPKMISKRAKGIKRIVTCRENLHLGRNPKGNTAAEVAVRELQERATDLNSIDAAFHAVVCAP